MEMNSHSPKFKNGVSNISDFIVWRTFWNLLRD